MFQEIFIKHLQHNLGQHLPQIKAKLPIKQVLQYLLDQGLITPATMRHYAVVWEYQRLQEEAVFRNKTQTIRALARKLDLHENTIWNILKDYQGKFVRPDRNTLK